MPAPHEPPAAQPLVLEPVADDGVRATVVGLMLWLLAGVACLLLREQLADRGSQWWVWTCLAGVGIGLGMLWFTRRRARAYREHRGAATGPRSADGRG